MNKEMTIVWHDLLEDPNDLPPVGSNSKVWSEKVYVQTKSGHRILAEYRHGVNRPGLNEEEGWYNDFINKLNEDDIEAWTYIPKYYSREKRIDNLLMKLPFMVFHRIEKNSQNNEYPEPHEFVIVFQYKEGKGIVSSPGFYDKDMGWMMTTYTANKQIDIDDVIGWSPFFNVKE